MPLRNQHGPAHHATDDPAVIAAVAALLERHGASGGERFLTPDGDLGSIWGDPGWREAVRYLAPDCAELVPGLPNACHGNTADLAAEPGVEWWFGYALNDGMWRVHSWGYQPGTGTILETTVPREGYIGGPLPVEHRTLLVPEGRGVGGWVKLFVPIADSAHLDGEWLWAEPRAGGTYRVANVPFFAVGLTIGSVVTAPGGTISDVVSHAHDCQGWVYATDHRALGAFAGHLAERGVDVEVAAGTLAALAFDAAFVPELLALAAADGVEVEWLEL